MRTSLACLAALALFACDDAKSSAPATPPTPSATPAAPEPKAEPKPSAAPAPTAAASAAADAPKCPPGMTGNALPAYCIKLPAGFAVKDARTLPERGSIAYDTGIDGVSLLISYDSTSFAEQTKDAESELKFGGDKIAKQGVLPGGGKWYEGAHQEYSRVLTVVKGKPPVSLKCSFTYKTKSPPAKDAIDVCRTLAAP